MIRALCLALSVAAATGCGWRSDGVRLHMTASTALDAPAFSDAAGIHWTAQDGTEVTVTRGWVTVSALEIVPCPTSALRRVWSELGYGTAHAHTASRPTRIGDPTVVSARQDAGGRTLLGTFQPPAARYCSLLITFAPADEDAALLPTEVDMVGKTLWLDGTRTPPFGTVQPFHLESAGTGIADLALGPVQLDEANLMGSQPIDLHPAAWLDGVDFSAGDPGPAALAAVIASTIAR